MSSQHGAARYLPAFTALVLGVVASLWAAAGAREEERARERLALTEIAEERTAAFEREVGRAIEVVRAVDAFFGASQRVDRDEFRSFARPFLEAHPTVLAIEWLPLVRAAERASYEASARAEGFGDLGITELDSHGALVPAGQRVEHLPVRYSEPLAANRSAIGFDHASDPNRAATLAAARDSGEARITARQRFFRHHEGFGVLLVQPVFGQNAPRATPAERRAGLVGYAVSILVIRGLVEASLLRDLEPDADVRVSIHDSFAPESDRLLYERGWGSSDAAAMGCAVAPRASVHVGGRVWSVQFNPRPGAVGAAGTRRYWTVLVIGLLLALALAGYLVLLRGRRMVIERRVEERTSELRVANERALAQARALEAANRDLEQRNRELNEFSWIASHDLQEPLRELTAFADQLREDLGRELPEEAEKDLVFIEEAARRMRTLVQDLLELSRTSKVELRREPVILDGCADRALAELDQRIAEAGATIERDPLGTALADEALVTQLYINLLGNALKFRGESAPVIRLTRAERDGEVVYGVRDNGLGIAPRYAGKIFTPFQRLHGREEYEGSGIGLAICRKVTERHGGRIWLDPSASPGAHLLFTLPPPAEED